MGWKTLELPVRRTDENGNQTIIRWKLLGSRGERSIEVGGITLDEAMSNLGISLGVIPKQNVDVTP